MVSYTRYRLECGIRSSVVLGFVGLPTIGFYLDTALKQGDYGDAASLFYALVLLIVSLRWWLRVRLAPFYVVAAFIWLPPVATIDWTLFWQFFGNDLIPAPWRGLGSLSFSQWFFRLTETQLLPGLFNTLVVAQIALVLTGVLALIWFPLNSSLFLPGWRKNLGDSVLVVVRTIPEVLLSFIVLLLIGPSMIPAILALGIHNGAIIAHLVGGASDTLKLRDDAPKKLMRYSYEVLPRIYRQFLAFLFYRWEIIMRETAMLGILGIPTLGFYIDSAFESLYFDRALMLILATAVLNMSADQLAHFLRNRLHLKTTPESL
jgi:phosphonate transport system permease protein